jgi:small conductance mechanosensitive channel
MANLAAMLTPYLIAAILLLLTAVFALLVRWLVGRLMRQSNSHVVAAARLLAAAVVWLVGVTLAFQAIGLSADILLLIVGLLGVAILIALWEPLANFGAKYFTDLYTPFKVGDTVEVQGRSGKVLEINAMTTVLLGENEQLISVPNTAFIREVVVNTTPKAWKELTIPITLSGNADLPAFESDLRRTLSKLRHRLDSRFPPLLTTRARTAQSTDLVLTLMLRAPEDREPITLEVNKRLSEVIGRARPTAR